VGTSAATFESFARLILLENLHSTPSLIFFAAFHDRSECEMCFGQAISLRLSEEDTKGSGEVRTGVSSP